MICNVIDMRTRLHRWKRVNAIVEASWHFNMAKDADQAEFPERENEVTWEELTGVTVEEAVQWAISKPCPVTLFLYDEDVRNS